MNSLINNMKILFYGDSITDMGRARPGEECACKQYGMGYPHFIMGELKYEDPTKYDAVNTGISGNRVVDLYQRVKVDCWNHNPDVLSILIGVNDVWHELIDNYNNGVDIERYEKVYRMLIEDTLKKLPNVKIIMLEPFVCKGSATEEKWESFKEVYEYAKVAKKIAEDYNIPFVPLQKKIDEAVEKYGVYHVLYDGVHPNVFGAKLVANEWIKVFKEKVLC